MSKLIEFRASLDEAGYSSQNANTNWMEDIAKRAGITILLLPLKNGGNTRLVSAEDHDKFVEWAKDHGNPYGPRYKKPGDDEKPNWVKKPVDVVHIEQAYYAVEARLIQIEAQLAETNRSLGLITTAFNKAQTLNEQLLELLKKLS